MAISQKENEKKVILAILIVGIILSAAIIFAFLSIPPMPPPPDHATLTVRISPNQLSVAKGEQVHFEAYAFFKNSSSDVGVNVSAYSSLSITTHWSSGADILGTLTRGKTLQSVTYFVIKTTVIGNSSLTLTFKYIDENLRTYTVNKSVNITVNPPVLDYIEINPPERMTYKGRSTNFSATVRLTDATEVNATFEWNLTDSRLGTLNTTIGKSVRFTAGSQHVSGNLTCDALYDGVHLLGYAHIIVFAEFPQQSVKTRIYDMFNVPLGDWWLDRYQETIIHNSFPFTYAWHGTPAGNDVIYSDYRMNVLATNFFGVNTSENPWYVPILNPMVRGGNIQLDWEGNYLSHDEAVAYYPESIVQWFDSWFWRLNGTVTMDKIAARMVLNMTDAEFDDFATWKLTKFADFRQKFSNWINSQMNVVWAIKFMSGYEGNVLSESYDISRNGDQIVFEIQDHLSWGMECLLSRWWSKSFTQFEGWPEDVHFTALIGPLWSNLSLDCAIQYSLKSSDSMRDGRTAWILEATLGDWVAGSYELYDSEFNPYSGKSGWCKLVSNSDYGDWVDYDYAPLAWNLRQHDEIEIEWPSSNQIIGYNHNGPGNYSITEIGNVDPLWIEPVPGDVPSNVHINYTSRTILFNGPLDTLSWSKNTLSCQELSWNWSRLHVLPWGCPRIEFVVNNEANLPPTAVISAPVNATANISISMSSVSFDLDGTIMSQLWDFGDGNTSTSATVTKNWTLPGNYLVTLTVTDDGARTGTYSMIMRVT